MTRPKRNLRYDWAAWADGKYHEIVQGEDFRGTLENMRNTILQRGRKYGLDTETEKVSETTLRFIMVPPTMDPKNAENY